MKKKNVKCGHKKQYISIETPLLKKTKKKVIIKLYALSTLA